MGSGWKLGYTFVLGSLLAVCGPCAGRSHEMKKMPSAINAALGQSVTIPCSLVDNDGAEPDLRLSHLSFLWKRILKNGSEIDVYKWAESSSHVTRPGASINSTEVKRGNFSLTLPNVQRDEEGRYQCTIFLTPKKYSNTTNLQLFAEPDVTLSTPNLTLLPNMEKSVTCAVSKFYPREVEVRWEKIKSSGTRQFVPDADIYLTKTTENPDGSFNVTSLLIVAPSSTEENGDVYSCVVSQKLISKSKHADCTLTVPSPTVTENSPSIVLYMVTPGSIFVIVSILLVWLAWHFLKEPPRISEIVGVEDLVHMKRSALTFMASGFKPKNIVINMYLQRVTSRNRHKIASWKYPPTPEQDGGQPQVGELQPINSKDRSSLENEIQQPLHPKKSWMTYSCLCSTHITPDKERDDGATLTIEVLHDALTSPLTLRKTLVISDAEPVGKPFTFPNEEH